MDVKVAFVLPVKNESSNIEGILDTIFAQVGIEPEIVVVDNGSTDDTVARATKRGVKLIRCSGWLSDCRMAGTRATVAPVLFFVDADQRLEGDTCARALRELGDPHVNAVVVPERPFEPRTVLERIAGAERAILEASGRGIPRIFRRARYLEIGGHPSGILFGEDYVLLEKLKPEEVRVADSIVYHREISSATALLKKYFAYGRRMTESTPVRSLFTYRAGSFLAQVARHSRHAPFSALGAAAVKCAKLAALRLGMLSVRLKTSRSEPARNGLSLWWGIAVAASVPILMCWRMVLTPGVLIMGDHVSPGSAYWTRILGSWYQFEHGGTPNVSLPFLPYFAALAVFERVLGHGTGDKVLILLFFSIAIAASAALLFSTFKLELKTSLLLGVFYAFNPWTASRLASGHTELLMAYALTPVIVLVWRSSYRSPLFTAFIVAAQACLNTQLAALTVVALIVLGRGFGGFRRSLRDAAVAAAFAVGMSLWWILPLLRTHGGNTGHTGLENILSYTQLADVAHTMTLRSYWWPAFSDGLYRYSNPAANAIVFLGMAAIVLAELAVLASWRWLSSFGRAGVALWFFVSLVLILAHAFPAAYWEMLRIPMATLYRDPDKLVALSLLGFVIGFADFARHFRWNTGTFAAASVAVACITFPWWSSGDLRGNVQPQTVRDGSVAAAAWLAKHDAGQLVLWWPNGPYIRYWWYPAGGQDPLRYWTSDPMWNPYYDPAYDASPRTSELLYALATAIPQRNVPYLGGLLGTYGIRYIAVRNRASTSFTDFPGYRPDFDAIRDLRRVAVFGDTDIYENLAWQAGRYLVGHYDALVTGDFTTMLSLDPELTAAEILVDDASPKGTSYEYVGLDRQLERALTTYRYESGASYDLAFSSDLSSLQRQVAFSVACQTCDALLLRTNAAALRITIDGLPSSPPLLYADLPNWQPRWRAYAIPAARRIAITTTDPNAYVYQAALVSRRALDLSMQSAFDEVRHHWPTYVANQAELDMRPAGPDRVSDRLGPIVETDSRRWHAIVVGSRLSAAQLRFYWWQGRAREREAPMRCAIAACTADVTLARGFHRVALVVKREAIVQGLVLSSAKPQGFDNVRADVFPRRMDADTKLLVPMSYSPDWNLQCARGSAVRPAVGNGWATLYAPNVSVSDCALHYGPDWAERIGAVLSVLALVAAALIAVLFTRRRERRADVSKTDGAAEIPV